MLINKQNKAVIFDMDGVIFDSEQAVFNGWKELSQKYGFENLDIPYMKCIGVNAASSKRIFLDYYGEDFPYDKYKDEQSKNYHEKYDGGRLPLKKGVRELLQNLKTNNYKALLSGEIGDLLQRPITIWDGIQKEDMTGLSELMQKHGIGVL